MTNFLMIDESGRAVQASDAIMSMAGDGLALLAPQLRVDAATKRTNYVQVADHLVQRRADAASAAGVFSSMELTHRMKRILEEPLPPLNSREVFHVNTDPRPGSRSYEQYRFSGAGKAVVYRGGMGSDIPEVGIAQAQFIAPIVYMVSLATIDILEEMSAGLTGLDLNSRKLERARRAIFELQNEWTWTGSQEHNLFGLLNHPFIDTAVSQVDYVTATAALDILADLYVWADYADSASSQTFRSDTLVISNKLKNALTGRIVPDTNGRNVLQMLLEHKPHIKKVIPVRELDGRGGSASVHVLAFMRSGSGADSSAEIVSAMEPVFLPADRSALGTRSIMMAGFGGLNATEVGSMLVVYVNGEA